MRVLLLSASCLIASAAGVQLTSRPSAPAPRPATPPLIDSRAPGPVTWRELGDVRDRIEDGRDEGALSRREARRLKRETRQVGRLADRYGQDGLSASEQRELETRTRVLRDQVNVRRARGKDAKAGR